MANARLDLDAILRPFSEESPCGGVLDKSDANGSYHRVKGLRDDALASEEAYYQASLLPEDDEGDVNLPDPPDWNRVVQAGSEILVAESKDFRVASWVGEALLRLDGFLGLAEGLALCRGLCEEHWPAMHPQPDEDGHLDRVSALGGLASQTVSRLLRLQPAIGRYSVWDYKEASGGGAVEVSLADIQAAASSEQEAISEQLSAINQSLEQIEWLTEFLLENCLPDSYEEPTQPSLSSLKDELEDAKRVLGAVASQPSDESTDEDSEGGVDNPPRAPGDGALRTREEALKSLAKIADFFAKTEPHSPMSYALRQVMGWGRMSLPELLAELISDRSVRDDLQRRVGVPLGEQDD